MDSDRHLVHVRLVQKQEAKNNLLNRHCSPSDKDLSIVGFRGGAVFQRGNILISLFVLVCACVCA